jgi:hypothetical protein
MISIKCYLISVFSFSRVHLFPVYISDELVVASLSFHNNINKHKIKR